MHAVLCLFVAAQSPPPRPLTWDDFPVIVWRQDRDPAELDGGGVRAFGATNLGRGEDGAPLLARGLAFYVDNAAGRNELHLDRDAEYTRRFERWYETRDPALLVREPCLNDPAVRARMAATLERTLSGSWIPSALGVSLGDEVSFTPYGSPEDTCLCAHCRRAWKEFLARAAARGTSDLEPDFDPARASTDAARAALESGDARTVHAWLLRRAFAQETLQARLAELAAAARAQRPEVPLGLLGMIGRTAFGGVTLEKILPQLGFFECYRVGAARELAFTLRRPDQRAVQTIFFDAGSPAAPTWCAWESWMRGAGALVIWSDRELAAQPAYAQSLARATERLRAVRRAAAGFAPRPLGAALVLDEDSTAYGWLVDAGLDGPTWPRRLQGWQEEHGSRERSSRAWLRVLEDVGAMPGALPLSAVEAGAVERFPLLVLNHLRVLDEAGGARLAAFLGAGGKLAVRGDLGRIDPRGRASERSWLERLRAQRPDAVHEFGPELDGYPAERLAGGNALRERVGKLAGARPGLLAPWRIANHGPRVPWLAAWSTLPDGCVLGAALPNLAEAAEREERALLADGTTAPRLRDLEVEVTPPAGFELTWIHPPGAEGRACRLPAGEAAVFRLAPLGKR